MPRIIPETAREHADLALAVYVEELAAKRRVLFVGDASSAVPERLSSVARSVDVVSPRTRARGTRRGGRILPRPWPSARDAASWDLVLVPDLMWAGIPSPERIAELSEWLTPGGVLVVGAEERDEKLDYEALYDVLARSFEHVRMLGQAPFAGWAVVDFAPHSRELEVTFDGSLLGGTGEEPARFVALCAARDVVLDAYAIVQVPFASSRATESAPSPALEAQLRERQDELKRAHDEVVALNEQLTSARAKVDQSDRRAEQTQRDLAKATAKIDDAQARADVLAKDLEVARREIEAFRAAPQEDDRDRELAQLETSLRDRAHDITELRLEVERRGVLVRDLVEALKDAREPTATAIPVASAIATPVANADEDGSWRTAALDARKRVVAAEASVAEATFRVDELRAELATFRRQRDTDLGDSQRVVAEHQGTSHGLRARLAELEEVRRLGEARLALALDDVGQAKARTRDLERELAEARDQIGLSVVRLHGRPKDANDDVEDGRLGGLERELETERARVRTLENEIAEKEGRLYGAMIQAREVASDLRAEKTTLARDLARIESELAQANARFDADRSALETRLGSIHDEAARSAEEHERHLREIDSLRARTEVDARDLDALRGEREGLRLRLADAEASLATRPLAVEPPPPIASANQPSPEEVELRQRVELLTASSTHHAARETEAMTRADAAERRSSDLAVRIATRDAMISRISSEIDLAAARRDTLERKVREQDGELTLLREQLDQARAVADVRADEERREVRRAEQRVSELERERETTSREHEETRTALAEARQILSQIAGGLDAPAGSGPSTSADAARLRDQLDRAARDVEDRDLMLRSLTAQLQDRDDRIRALDRLQSGSSNLPSDARELQQRVLVSEERASRVERELEQERSARRVAEEHGGGAERDADLRRLSQLLGDRDAQLMVLEGRVGAGDRETRAMRDTFAQARSGLETLLGEIANDQRAEAADRIAAMLRLLRRY